MYTNIAYNEQTVSVIVYRVMKANVCMSTGIVWGQAVNGLRLLFIRYARLVCHKKVYEMVGSVDRDRDRDIEMERD